jgi:hypothetical protein
MRQVEGLYKSALPKGLDKSTRGEFRRTFKEACALRVKERAEKLMREMKQNNDNATGHNALVVTGYFDQLSAENDAFWNERFASAEAIAEKHKALAAQRRQEMLDNMPEDVRKAFLENERKAKEREEKEAQRRASRPRKGRRERRLRAGVGTNAGFAAAASVKLRDEIK